MSFTAFISPLLGLGFHNYRDQMVKANNDLLYVLLFFFLTFFVWPTCMLKFRFVIFPKIKGGGGATGCLQLQEINRKKNKLAS